MFILLLTCNTHQTYSLYFVNKNLSIVIFIFFLIETEIGPVEHTCNPNHSGGCNGRWLQPTNSNLAWERDILPQKKKSKNKNKVNQHNSTGNKIWPGFIITCYTLPYIIYIQLALENKTIHSVFIIIQIT